MSSRRLQLVVLRQRRGGGCLPIVTGGCLPIVTELQVSPQLELCGVLLGEQLHVFTRHATTSVVPRLQLHVFNTTVTLWCFVEEG